MTKTLKIAMMAALIAAGSAGTAAAAEKVRVLKSAAICFCFMPLDFGKELGIWQKRGIDIEIGSTGGDARVQQAMVSDSIDIGMGSGPGLGLLSKGVPAKGIMAIVDRPAGMALIVLPNSPIQTAAQLKGKKIGVTTGGSLTDWLARKAIESAGLAKGDAQILPLGDLSSNAAALTSGSSDAMVYGSEAGYSMQADGKGKVIMTFDRVVPKFIAHVVFVTDKMRTERPQVVKQFVEGWFEVVAYMRENRAETVAFAEKSLKLKPGVGGMIYDVVMPQMSKDGKFSEAALDILNQSFLDLGILPAKVNFNTLIDTQFLPK